MKRLFIAIDLPASIKRYLVDQYDETLPDVRWTPEANLHLTMRFLGDVEEEQEKEVRAELSKIRVSRFTLSEPKYKCAISRVPLLDAACVGNMYRYASAGEPLQVAKAGGIGCKPPFATNVAVWLPEQPTTLAYAPSFMQDCDAFGNRL